MSCALNEVLTQESQNDKNSLLPDMTYSNKISLIPTIYTLLKFYFLKKKQNFLPRVKGGIRNAKNSHSRYLYAHRRLGCSSNFSAPTCRVF